MTGDRSKSQIVILFPVTHVLKTIILLFQTKRFVGSGPTKLLVAITNHPFHCTLRRATTACVDSFHYV